MSLRSRILLFSAVPALLVGVTATWIVTGAVRSEILERVRENGEREGEARAAWLSDFMRRRVGELRALAASAEARRGDEQEILALLSGTHAVLSQAFEALYWVDGDGNVLGTDGSAFSVLDRDDYPAVRAGSEVITPLSASRASTGVCSGSAAPRARGRSRRSSCRWSPISVLRTRS